MRALPNAVCCLALQVAEFVKLICKVFWSATFMAVPPILLQQEQFSGWMMALHSAMRRPLPWATLPAGLDERRKWVWFKALKWVLHITYRLFNRRVGQMTPAVTVLVMLQ